MSKTSKWASFTASSASFVNCAKALLAKSSYRIRFTLALKSRPSLSPSPLMLALVPKLSAFFVFSASSFNFAILFMFPLGSFVLCFFTNSFAK